GDVGAEAESEHQPKRQRHTPHVVVPLAEPLRHSLLDTVGKVLHRLPPVVVNIQPCGVVGWSGGGGNDLQAWRVGAGVIDWGAV
ncbi:MAG: hypothetical protein ACRDQA_15830, partial [Nocardioidaceae bacterium]